MTDYQKTCDKISAKLENIYDSQEKLIRSILKKNNQQINGEFGDIVWDQCEYQVYSVYIDVDSIFVYEDDCNIPPVACSLIHKKSFGIEVNFKELYIEDRQSIIENVIKHLNNVG